MKPLQYSAPESLEQALQELGEIAAAGGAPGVLGGGTDLIIQLRSGRKETGHLVDIKKIPELNVLSYSDSEGLRLGAAVPCAVLGEFQPAVEHYPGLVEGAELIGSTQIQSRATVGGNLCNGSPAADAICSLIVLGAVCVVAGPGGQREVPAAGFMTGPGETALQPGELLVEIRVPPPPPHSADAYLRFIPRNEMDIAVAGAAVNLTLEADRATVQSATIAIGAVAPTPLLVEAAGSVLAGRKLEPAALEEAAQASQAAAQPITDMRGPADYRRHLAGVLTKRALLRAAERIQQG